MKEPQDLSRLELEAIVSRIQAILYATPYLDAKGRERTKFDRNKVWGTDELEEIDEVLVNADLSPPDPDDACRPQGEDQLSLALLLDQP